MATYHSTAMPNVYHNRKDCSVGSKIEKRYRRAGDGGRPLCWECIRKSRQQS